MLLNVNSVHTCCTGMGWDEREIIVASCRSLVTLAVPSIAALLVDTRQIVTRVSMVVFTHKLHCTGLRSVRCTGRNTSCVFSFYQHAPLILAS